MLCNENGGTNTERFWLLIYIPKSLSSPSPSNPYPLNSINCRTASESPTPKNCSFNNNKTRKNKGITSDSNPFPPPPLPTPLPKPPTGFVVDQRGKVLTASRDRLATLLSSFSFLFLSRLNVDPANNLSLECVVRRQLTSSQGDDCMLLCPDDMPIQMLKNTSDGWLDVSDEELESILPAAAYALVKIRLYLIHSGYVRLLP
ncbi:hypothetical protein VNO78_17011 [Psophocarpus tetragonolobus]|uniref:Uncharacterized protein n=1 Tax=Psophocarpus tetragonolobus TaxID=3891 RepID=A0AAN9SHJ5_PSOTE